MLRAGGSSKEVALVIGSGNLKCAAALGLMKVLEREGISVTMAVGCSAGSVFASMIALGHDAEATKELTLRLWTRDIYRHYHYPSLLRALFPRSFRRGHVFGLADDRWLMTALEATFGDRTFADTRIPLYLVATDITDGEQAILSEGRLVDAVRASVSLPVIWQPWKVGGQLLIDGGAANPLPVDVAVREGAEIILAMGFQNTYYKEATTLKTVVRQTMSIMMNNLLKSTYAFYNLAHHTEIIPILPRFNRPIGLTDTHLIPYIIEEGERVAQEQIPYLRRLLSAPTP